MPTLFTASLLVTLTLVTGTAADSDCSSLIQLQQGAPAVLNRTETDFVKRVLMSYGKQSPSYVGAQVTLGFKSKELIDDKGQFAFADNVKSVGIDVGAANNPLIFDMDRDWDQVVLAFEPVFGNDLGKALEKVAGEVQARGGCKTRWEGFCANQRLVVLPCAVSHEIGHAKFHVAANPYCSSLNTVPGGLDPSLVNSPDPEISGVMKACWGSINKAQVLEVPTVTLASILRRIPKDVRVKYIKIDAQGQDYKILMSAAEEMSRIEYVRFEMQVDPPPGRKMVEDIPSYAEVEAKMKELGFVHKAGAACNFDAYSSPFSKAIEEKECIFCRKLPCQEAGMKPLGRDPRTLLAK